MTDAVGGTAAEQVVEEAMVVRGHGDQVDVFFVGDLHELGGGITEGEACASFEPLVRALVAEPFEVGAVVLDLLRLAELQLLEVSRGPPVGDVDEKQLRLGQGGQAGDMRKDGAVGVRVFDGDENVAVHRPQKKVCQSSQTLSAAIMKATGHASHTIHRGATSSPIFRRSLVNRTSGNTANGSCRLRTTWLKIRSAPLPRSP